MAENPKNDPNISSARRIGIDAGSKTIKAVILDEDGNIVHSIYRRHRSNIKQTLREVVHDLIWSQGDAVSDIRVTGSAGIAVSELLGLPFIQEVTATVEAVKRNIPRADAIIELGGEDAKVMYLTDGLEQRMNATCAGGTGGFIDTAAFMLDVKSEKFGSLAMGAQQVYPIASRCAVFAQTDIRPLLNQGVSKADIAMSVIDAVVRQTLGGLACGRPLRGNIVFLGGPFEHIPVLSIRFRNVLGLNSETGIKPKNAHLYPAIGAALAEMTARNEPPSRLMRLSRIEEMLCDDSLELSPEGLARLERLFTNERELEAFRARHDEASYPEKDISEASGPLFLGIDSGSTTVKLALLDEDENLLYHDYQPSRGDAVRTVKEMLEGVYASLPKKVRSGWEAPYIAHVTATGYGEPLLREGFGADSGVVETTAHAKAAIKLCPEASFVLDIGGQDMKALWIRSGFVNDAVLNEACSSGCGAFLEGTAHSLQSSPETFASRALLADAPVDLGMRCTVFMSSRVKHAQKIGASFDDIAAGAAYSVIQNALYRIIGKNRLSSMGSNVIVQGGTFASDAVLRAFELMSGAKAIRPNRAPLMGAIGAALVARERHRALASVEDAPAGSLKSGLMSRSELASMKIERKTYHCDGCGNKCALSVLDLGARVPVVTGNRCERGRSIGIERIRKTGQVRELSQDAELSSAKSKGTINTVALEQRLIADACSSFDGSSRKNISIGMINGLEGYRYAPFWNELVRQLGFSVVATAEQCNESLKARAWETVPAEGICFPAKLLHVKAFQLLEEAPDALFMPRAIRRNHCAVSCGYAKVLEDGIPAIRNGNAKFISPELSSTKPVAICESGQDRHLLLQAFSPLCELSGVPLDDRELEAALEQALFAQHAFEEELADATDEVLGMLETDPKARAVVLAGRPYHIDPAVLHGIDEMLVDLGFNVLTAEGLGRHLDRRPHRKMGLPEWHGAKRLLRIADFCISRPQVQLVCLQSFGCGYDAVTIDEVRLLLEENGRPFTSLKIDEMVETAHIRIRLRTLAETLEGRSFDNDSPSEENAHAGKAEKEPSKEPDGCVIQESLNAGIDLKDDDAHISLEHGSVKSPETEDEAPYLLNAPLDEEDLALARQFTPKDICFSAAVLAARAIRIMNEDPSIKVIKAPEACKACLNEAIPLIVERATGLVPRFIWEDELGGSDTTEDRERDQKAAKEDAAAACMEARHDDACGETEKPLIGIIGNPLMMFEPFMNDEIATLIRELGCEVAFPDAKSLFTDDVRYIDQLRRFQELGAKHVIYMQSFGCVKAYVDARGARDRLKKLFPDMPITVIDYDPEASALNRENRIRLVVESVLRESLL